MSKFFLKEKDLIDMVQKEKRENKTCTCYSKMKKRQLLNLAIEIGLIERNAKELDDLRKRSLKEIATKC